MRTMRFLGVNQQILVKNGPFGTWGRLGSRRNEGTSRIQWLILILLINFGFWGQLGQPMTTLLINALLVFYNKLLANGYPLVSGSYALGGETRRSGATSIWKHFQHLQTLNRRVCLNTWGLPQMAMKLTLRSWFSTKCCFFRWLWRV